jgi:CRP-like cAMP-binding protein
MALDQDIILFSGIGLFSNLDSDALRLIAFAAETRMVGSGDVLFREGHAADCGYVVIEGEFVLTDAGGLSSGRKVGPGTLLGEIALIVETTRPATATATTPSAVMRIPRTLFRRVLTEFPVAAQRVHAEFRAKMRSTSIDLAKARSAFLAIDRQ